MLAQILILRRGCGRDLAQAQWPLMNTVPLCPRRAGLALGGSQAETWHLGLAGGSLFVRQRREVGVSSPMSGEQVLGKWHQLTEGHSWQTLFS